MVAKAQTPFEIGIILIVFLLFLIIIRVLPSPFIRQQLAITTKTIYTSNEASLTLLTLLNLKYDGVHTVYHALSVGDINQDVSRFIAQKLRQLSNVDCFRLSNETSIIISSGDCKSFDYVAEAKIFKPYGKKLTERIILEYEKVKE